MTEKHISYFCELTCPKWTEHTERKLQYGLGSEGTSTLDCWTDPDCSPPGPGARAVSIYGGRHEPHCY